MKEILTGKRNVAKIFSSEFWFNIPEYQRPYVWEKSNVINLLEDLFIAYKDDPEKEYFLGSLVLEKINNDKDEYDILDGQQRITTLYLIFAAMRDFVEDDSLKNELQKNLFQEKIVTEGIPQKERIVFKIRNEVHKFIQEYILKNNGTKSNEIEKNDKNISLFHMKNAILAMHEFFNEKLIGQDMTIKFITYIKTKVIFIYVATENKQDAFRLFTILNNRGVQLSSADILKATNIGEIEEKDKEIYAKKWEELEENFADKFDQFLSFIRNAERQDKPNENLLEEYEKMFKDKILIKGKYFFELIEEYNEIYQNVINLQGENLSNEYKNLIHIMHEGYDSKEWVPAVMYYNKKYSENGLVEFLKMFEFKFSSEWIIGSSHNTRRDVVNAVLKAIKNSNFYGEVLNNKEIFEVDTKVLQRELNGDIYKKRFAKYVLLKIEFLKKDVNIAVTSNYSKITLEHVLPQNPAEDSQWKKDFNDEMRVELTNKIGNLVLLSKGKNSKLGNSDYTEKKDKYLGKNEIFSDTVELINSNDKWTKVEIEARQNEIVNLFVENKHRKI